MSLWDPVLYEPSKNHTFGDLIARKIRDLQGRWCLETELRQMVRAGHVAEAVVKARTSDYRASIGLGAIAVEQALLGDAGGASATAKLIADACDRSRTLIDVAEIFRRASSEDKADAALTEAVVAAGKIHGVGSEHWRARSFAEIGLARHRLSQAEEAQDKCRLALTIAKARRGETRDQTLGDVARGLCMIGDLETAAVAIHEIRQDGHRQRAVATLAAAYLASRRLSTALKLLAGLQPFARFDALRQAGRLLGQPTQTPDVQKLLRDLPELDRLGVLIGYGSALQDLGLYGQAAESQQAALELARRCMASQGLPQAQRHTVSITKDLALNLARDGRFQSALDVSNLITETADKTWTVKAIAVCQAEAGDLEAFRHTIATLESTADQASALATGAAALVGAAVVRASQRKGNVTAMQELASKRKAEPMISESLRLARQVPQSVKRDALLLWVTVAAITAGTFEAAMAAALLIRDDEACHLAAKAINKLPTAGCEEILAAEEST